MSKNVTFNIKCTMDERWADAFIGMLVKMQLLGSVGSSRVLAFFSDGDGSFRPKFEIRDYDFDPYVIEMYGQAVDKPIKIYRLFDAEVN